MKRPDRTGVHRGLVLLLSMSGCRAGWERLDLAALPNAARFPDAPAVVLLDEKIVALGGDGFADVTHHRRVRVLRTEGAKWAHVAESYDTELSPMTAFAARTIAPDGSERNFGRGDASDFAIAGVGHTLYTSQRVLELAPPEVAGTVVEWRATQRVKDLRLPQFRQRFGEEVPVERARLEVRLPPRWRVEHLARRLDEKIDLEPERREEAGATILVWERRDLAALPVEPGAPSELPPAPLVAVRALAWPSGGQLATGFRDAREESAWEHRLVDETAAPTPELVAQANRLVAGLANPRARARRIYAFARDEVEYCAVEVGIGGLRPHRAADVLKYRYGDCKDKANLARGLLGAVGIPSRLVLIHHHDGFPVPFGLPTLGGNFDHAILAVDLPDGTVLADPTSKVAPFGRLPASDEGADVLPISADGTPLGRSPESPPSVSERQDRLDLALGAAGGLAGTFDRMATGHYADQMRMRLRTDKEFTAQLGLSVRRPRATLRAVDGKTPGEDESPVHLAGSVSADEGLHGVGASRFLRLSEIVHPIAEPLPHRARRDPVVLGFRRHAVEELRFTLPDDADEPSLPPPVELSTDFADYRLAWTAEGPRTLVARRELTLKERVVRADRYRALVDFLDGAAAAEARSIAIHLRGAP